MNKVNFTSDTDTKAGGTLTDFALFESFSKIKMSALDVTDYEGADIIHNMNDELPSHLIGKFDFIYNGSCLDNLFNPAEFLINCSKMLKPGGRIINIEHGSSWQGAYLMYSPDWFLDFFAINDYKDALVFVCEFNGFRSPHHMQAPWHLWNWNPLIHGNANEHSAHLGFSSRLILSVAEKGDLSTDERQPVQGVYRTSDDLNDNIMFQSYSRFLKSPRLRYYNPVDHDQIENTSISNMSYISRL